MDEEGGREGPLRILAIDGGGIGSLASSIWLTVLEEEMLGCGKGRLYERFDLVAGTSTGAIVACAVSLGIKAHCIADFFREERRHLFPGAISRFISKFGQPQKTNKPKYSCKPLESCLKKTFHTYKVGDARTRLMTLSYDALTHQPMIHKSWSKDCESIPMWFACKASMSAPGYFPATATPSSILLDGGLVANNPSLYALAEMIDTESQTGNNLHMDDVLLVSIGGGRICHQFEKQTRHWGFQEWSERIFDLATCAASSETDYICSKVIGDKLHRFQCDLPSDVTSIDDASDDAVDAIEQVALDFSKSHEFRKSIAKIIEVI